MKTNFSIEAGNFNKRSENEVLAEMEKSNRVQAIDRAMMILKCFSEKNREMKLSEISTELNLNKSTAHGIISTLKYHGLIDQDEETQKYRLGLYLMELGNQVINAMDIRHVAAPVINGICETIQETVHLGIRDKLEVVYIDKKESTQSMRIYTAIGARKPAHCTGVGKAMLAYVEPDLLAAMLPDQLEKFTPNTIVHKADLMKELGEIKENGIAFDKEEHIVGLFCVAAPIFDYTGKVQYAISVSGPSIRMNEEKIREATGMVKAAAAEISAKLGYKA